ncbi:DUF5361 domain-containing protein [Nocardia bhagyanarayanae]|uniref:Uncharacterized protein n=1 Tax=Nocardia bhagyanarayanae TaxID=1215925 RepID=A0A543F7S1_9NOCA|nr:DUF5361 domain-containing protein [Nocardia bhagyanarayanae]TQM29861.1 hypothetical protein FB390_1474 [Nocardia bhagyanarayanae]
MANPFGGRPGGILSLDALLEEHTEAIEYDLITIGLRLRMLGTDDLSWRDLKALIKQAPADSALARSVYGEDHQWQLGQHLLADMADSLRWLVWSKTKAAQDGRDRPEPIPRPGVTRGVERIGTAASIEAMNDFLTWDDQRPSP